MPDRRVANSIVVVAHPDDEVLWFSSWLEVAQEVVICFVGNNKIPQLQAAREAALNRHVAKNISSLGLTESGVYRLAAWEMPTKTDFGLEVSRPYANRSVFEKVRGGLSQQCIARQKAAQDCLLLYRSNYYSLRHELRKKLVSCARVITHSPWGEYGHEEHVQVHRAIMSLREEFNFKVSFPNYCSKRTLKLLSQELDGRSTKCETRPTNQRLAKKMMGIYQSNDCWTWLRNWDWFREESFITFDGSKEEHATDTQRIPLNYIEMAGIQL